MTSRNHKKGSNVCNDCDRDSVESENEFPKMVVNELLCYVMDNIKSSPLDNTAKAILDSCSPEEISEAKTTVWYHFEGELPIWEDRNNSHE